ncbi:MAG: adenylate kinase [Phycisphaerales bacterium]|nr:adenylate kinase [Phycisphaerales bacterium]MCB9854834.1 adenylate kinase [Phycisphaerales bacterium]
MNLILLGPPGAGKGTQAVQIAEAFGLLHLSSGDILRAERKARTELGQKAQVLMDRGALVPDDLILAMMVEHIGRAAERNGFLLDGFPRTLAQAQGLKSRLESAKMRLDHVVSVEVEDSEIVTRLTGRLYCPECGRTYHEKFSPPQVAGVCDVNGEKLLRRKDDTPEVVRQRLETYHRETKPLIAYYGEQGLLRSVSGVGEIDEVTARIKEACGA